MQAGDMQTTTIYVPFFSHLRTHGSPGRTGPTAAAAGTGLLMARFAPSVRRPKGRR